MVLEECGYFSGLYSLSMSCHQGFVPRSMQPKCQENKKARSMMQVSVNIQDFAQPPLLN